jgi:hypothetical protein
MLIESTPGLLAESVQAEVVPGDVDAQLQEAKWGGLDPEVCDLLGTGIRTRGSSAIIIS